jgi:NitT/TauT family transport system substrate-binding protein
MRKASTAFAACDMQANHRQRRDFVKGVAALAGAAGLPAFDMSLAAVEPPPETKTLRLTATPAICLAPQYVAEALLNAEGFTDVQYVKLENPSPNSAIASGNADISMDAVWGFMSRIDAGDPVTILAGVHLGCYQLIGSDKIKTVRDLKGKTVPVFKLGDPNHLFLSSIAAYVGLDPRKDINWITRSPTESVQLLAKGQVDAYLAFPPEPQEMKAKGIGHVIVNTGIDKPWAQYYCCVAAARRAFVQSYPVATKRALRALLKAADLCNQYPERAAQLLIEKKFASRYDYALQALRDVPYNAWRTYDPDNTLRFYSVRLHELGMIKSTPQKLIAEGTDWRFLNELKRELKA